MASRYRSTDAAARPSRSGDTPSRILIERHSINEQDAFEMLREHSRTTNRKLIDLAAAVLDGHHLLASIPWISCVPSALSTSSNNGTAGSLSR
jgi:hypothetical protein